MHLSFAPRFLLLPALVGVLTLASASAPREHREASAAWARTGHHLVARLARDRLSPAALAAADELLGGEQLASAAEWADDIRGQRKETEPLHFVNIPLDSNDYIADRDCPKGCIITAIAENRKALRDSTTPFAERAEALRFLIHFMGDLHQPLHVEEDHGDKGGNTIQVDFLGRSRNFHQIWDQDLIEARGLSEDAFVTELESRLKSMDLRKMQAGTLVDWALEGHAIARRAYALLPRTHSIDQRYIDATAGVLDTVLIRAGVRLAMVLNEDLAAYRPGRSRPVQLQQGQVYADWQARAHAGEAATVEGMVETVHQTREGTIYLNFGGPYPHQTFSGAVHGTGAGTLEQLNALAGKRLRVTGTITLYRGQPEIAIDSAGQISPAP